MVPQYVRGLSAIVVVDHSTQRAAQSYTAMNRRGGLFTPALNLTRQRLRRSLAGPPAVQEVHQGEDRAAETELAVTAVPLAYCVEDDGRAYANQYDDQQRHPQGFDLVQGERAPCSVNGPGGLAPGLRRRRVYLRWADYRRTIRYSLRIFCSLLAFLACGCCTPAGWVKTMSERRSDSHSIDHVIPAEESTTIHELGMLDVLSVLGFLAMLPGVGCGKRGLAYKVGAGSSCQSTVRGRHA